MDVMPNLRSALLDLLDATRDDNLRLALHQPGHIAASVDAGRHGQHHSPGDKNMTGQKDGIFLSFHIFVIPLPGIEPTARTDDQRTVRTSRALATASASNPTFISGTRNESGAAWFRAGRSLLSAPDHEDADVGIVGPI